MQKTQLSAHCPLIHIGRAKSCEGFKKISHVLEKTWEIFQKTSDFFLHLSEIFQKSSDVILLSSPLSLRHC